MVAQVTGLELGDFVHTLGDAHLYTNHLEQAGCSSRASRARLPKLVLDPGVRDLFDFRAEHVRIEGYDPHPAIRAEVSV
jgi:thymidylate synthase